MLVKIRYITTDHTLLLLNTNYFTYIHVILIEDTYEFYNSSIRTQKMQT